MIPKSALGIAAAGAGICFIGYCVYFDRKRRNDPNFKQRLREKRRQARNSGKKSSGLTELPDLTNPEAMQKFFFQEIQLGEELLAAGDIEGGVDHLSYAIATCGQPQQLLQVLQQTLPPQVFALLLEKLPTVGQRMSGLSPGGLSSSSSKPTSDAVLAEDDVE